ncbi:CRISPR-associated protein Cas1 [Companilactobacillus tucceti DSM 20183]|uniref:CRISPR-associated endonuclease Cas1 n=1 Tax=Companilactobacillus tucceti DSM 20183 TaxID=1423811 RepID=A0A0R1J6J4_9LACO|nr:type II CRISPR-associated endonuclease Cas1 [Companilactobacillus tucceti]KRK64435.1 CRISPR-associated protein Cas1 [Companilactobacillus tucceti DSM 20183]
MAWRIVHVKEGDLLRLRLDNLEIRKKDDKYYIPLSDITMVVLEGNKTSITTKLMSSFSQNNIALVICDDKYLPVGIYLPYGQYHHYSKRVIKQASWTAKQKDLLWQNVIKQKMDNQIAFARWSGVEQERLELMKDLVADLVAGDKTNREGHVAKVYFDSLYGKTFTRGDDSTINAAMNFGYAILRSCMARIVVGNGLVTMLGIFHKNEFNSFNLVDDLMEPYRPLMDYWINQNLLGDKNYLSYESRLEIIEFMNQKLEVKGKKMSIDNSMQEFVTSFITAIEAEEPEALLTIDLKNFVGEES